MFVFIYISSHDFEIPFLLYVLDERSVYDEIANRCGVLAAPRCCGTGQIVVVRREEQKHALAVYMSTNLIQDCSCLRVCPVGCLVGPCSSRPRVRVTSMPAHS